MYVDVRYFLTKYSNNIVTKGGLGRLAAWHLPVGPVGPASRWAATSDVEVGLDQTTYPVNS